MIHPNVAQPRSRRAVLAPVSKALPACLCRHLNRILMIVEYRTSAKLRRFYSVEDLAQEVVVEALHHRDRFQYQGESQFVRWISTIARRVVCERARTLSRIPLTLSIRASGSTGAGASGSRIAGPESTPSSVAMREEGCDYLRRLIHTLSESDQLVVGMFYFEGFTMVECAAEIGCTKDATAKRLYRAIRKLGGRLRRHFR